MNCINCGAFLTDTDLDYCPHCGANVLIQKKVDYLSKLYYNQGLEKASIRDLSGAISCLKQSLAYDKRNIRARNLLGLVYFETGEVVAALSEWVISKNIQKNRNLASEYIARLQANQNKLETINESIKKYNNALAMCREGHEDMAAIRLKKILSQNPKLIKGYHLLALIQMKNQEWNKARRTLKKAARIDKTNTTTLRFLREVDEQTGVTTKMEKRRKGLFGNEKNENDNISGEIVVRPSSYKERSKISLFFTTVLGFTGRPISRSYSTVILFPARAWSLPKLREKLPSPVIRQMQLPDRQRKSRNAVRAMRLCLMHILPCSRMIWIQRRWNSRRYMWIHCQILQRESIILSAERPV